MRNKKIELENFVNLKKKPDEIPKAKKRIIKPYYNLDSQSDSTLIFESRFESGNLLAAIKIEENTYQLVLQQDTNTIGYCNWYYFRVSNTKAGNSATFNIINMHKRFSMFNYGMKVLLFSEKKAEYEKVGWHRGGKNINYYENGIYKFTYDRRRNYRSLQFTVDFEYDADSVYIAYTLPYTYTDIIKCLNEYDKDEKKYYYVIRKTICKTLAGNNLDYVSISNTFLHKDQDNKKGLVIMARVHPGETVSSHIMKGVLDFITSSCPEAVYLRDNYMIKIVPMLNPDGVILGNYRTSLAGCDLNRRYRAPNEILHPEVFHTKAMILKMHGQRDVDLIIDLHGHSGLHNVFSYGNKISDDPNTTKHLPFAISQICPAFNFDSCNWKMPKFKRGTARINLYNETEKLNIFTIEASYSGSNMKEVMN